MKPLEAAERNLRKRIRERGGDTFLAHELGSLLFRQGKVAEAREIWDLAAKKEASLPGADLSIVLEILNSGRLEDAERLLARLETSLNDRPHFHLAQGCLALRQGDLEVAELGFIRAYDLDPKLMVTNIWLGVLYERLGQWADARKYYEAATEIAPSRPDGWKLLASFHFKRDEIEQAFQALRLLEQTEQTPRPAEVILGTGVAGVRLGFRFSA